MANISNVNIDATDPQGMTAFHHCVFSLNFGSFDNGDLVKLLMSAHGNPLKADMKGELPKDSALMRGAARISEALQSGVSVWWCLYSCLLCVFRDVSAYVIFVFIYHLTFFF